MRLKMHYFHTKLPFQKPMLRQIEWWVQNGPMATNGVLPVTTLFFENFVSAQEPLIKSWFDVPTTQMSFIWRCFFPVSILKCEHIHEKKEEFFWNWAHWRATDSCRDEWNVQKVQKSVDVIMKIWLYRLSLLLKHSCCQSKKWLFELLHLRAAKSKF